MPKSDFVLQLAIFGMSAAILGLLVVRLYPSSFVKSFIPQEPNPLPPQQTLASEISPPPSFISIPNLNLNLAVAPGIVKDNKWTLYDDKVSWLTTSETPDRGNVIVYGHNRANIFGTLTELQTGDEIIITAGDRTTRYQVSQKRQVKPEDVTAIISDKRQLTLYTCDGTFDQKRLVVISYPVLDRASKI